MSHFFSRFMSDIALLCRKNRQKYLIFFVFLITIFLIALFSVATTELSSKEKSSLFFSFLNGKLTAIKYFFCMFAINLAIIAIVLMLGYSDFTVIIYYPLIFIYSLTNFKGYFIAIKFCFLSAIIASLIGIIFFLLSVFLIHTLYLSMVLNHNRWCQEKICISGIAELSFPFIVLQSLLLFLEALLFMLLMS